MAGFLDTQSSANQTEALYIAYFGRAADGPGYLYWTADLSEGASIVSVANSFAVQPEAKGQYTFLASPPTVLNPTDPVQMAGVTSFVQSIYQHLFSHAADSTGLTYWVNAILSGQLSIGSAVYAIGDGATGNDQTILANKIAAAGAFTSQTYSANITSGAPFITAAQASVSGVINAATEAASVTATTAYVSGTTPGNTLTLTPGQDSLSTSTAGAVFSAPLVLTSIQIAAQSFGLQTLTTGDSLTDSVGDGTLNATLDLDSNPAIAVVANVTMTGIKTANLVNVSPAPGTAQGFEGAITGLTTVNVVNSNGGIQLGTIGAGLLTPLTNVSVTGYTGPNGSAVFAGVIAAAVGSATNTISVSLSGILGGTGGNPVLQAAGLLGAGVLPPNASADTLLFSTDGPAGTKASPNTSYGTWAITANSNANLQLIQNGVGAATTLKIAGAGNVALGEDAAGNWQKLTTIDASGSTGNVTITGHATNTTGGVASLGASNTAGTGNGAAGANPFGLFGSVAGLLDGNTSLTSYKESSGVNILDVSSDTPAQVAALTTSGAGNTQTTNEIIVTSLAADTTTTSTFANIAGFQILGVTGTGGVGGGDTGVLTWSNLPTSFNDLLYQTLAAGALTINSAPATLTEDTEANGNGFALTVNAVAGAASTDTLIVGNSALKNAAAVGVVGNVTMTGEETVTLTLQGPTVASGFADFVGAMLLTPASSSGHEAVTIGGASSATIGGANGAIADLAFGVTPATLNQNNLTITDTDTGVVTFVQAAAGAALTAPIAGDTPGSTPVYSTNALSIDAHTSGGLLMGGGDANFSTLTTAGDTITGSTTAGNVLIGSIGNDTITGTSAATATDTIDTGGGADKIVLAASHTVSDQVDLYGGHGAPVAGVATTATGSSIVTAGDVAQLGWWGLATNGAATAVVPTLFANGTGTSADMSTVANFANGSAAKPIDSVNISVSAFSGLLHDEFTGGLIAGSGLNGTVATFSTALSPAGAVAPTTGNANASVLVLGTSFANANAVATSLGGAGTGITIHTTGANPIEHFLVAYQDLNGNTRIADVDLHTPAATTNTAAGGVGGVAGEMVAVSDMVQLTGVAISSLVAGNVHFTV